MYILMALGFFILLFVAYRYYRTHSLRWVLMIFGVLLIAVDWYGIKQAQVHHFGMVKQEINKSVAIQPKATVSNFNFITISEAKNSSAQYHYMMHNKAYKTVTNGVPTRVVRNAPKATLKSKQVAYNATSFWRKLLLIGLPDNTLVDSKYTFSLPKTWHVVTSKQLKEVTALTSDTQAKINSEVTKEVKAQMAAKIKANKKFAKDTDAQKALQKQIITKVTTEVNKEVNQAITAKLDAWNV